MNTFKQLCSALCAQWRIFAVIFAVMSLITFIVYGVDKAKAKKGSWRTPEKTLIALAFLFGSPGAFLGMKVFRHKTKHIKFQILVPLAFLLHLVLAGVVFAFGWLM